MWLFLPFVFNAFTMQNLTVELPEKIHNLAGGEAYKVSVHYKLVSLLLTSFMQNQFYRSSAATTDELKRVLLQADTDFAAKAAVFARTRFGMRSITHLLAASLAPKLSGKPWAKRFYEQVVHRPDDMCRILEHYKQGYGNKALPNAMKRGFAQAFGKFDSYQLAKYKNTGEKVSLMDVVRWVHPKATEHNQEGLQQLTEGTLKNTATWESKLSEAGKHTDEESRNKAKKEVWVSLLESKRLGYFALLRNLKNIIEQAPEAIDLACEQLTNRHFIKKSLVLPFRFDTAHQQLLHNPRPVAPPPPHTPYLPQKPHISDLSSVVQKVNYHINQFFLKDFLKKSPDQLLEKILRDLKQVAFAKEGETPAHLVAQSRKKQQGFAQLRQVAEQVLQHEAPLKNLIGKLMSPKASENKAKLSQNIAEVQTAVKQIFRDNILFPVKQYEQVIIQWSQSFSKLFQLLPQGIQNFEFAHQILSLVKDTKDKVEESPQLFFIELLVAVRQFFEQEKQNTDLQVNRARVIKYFQGKQKESYYLWQTYQAQLKNYYREIKYYKASERKYKNELSIYQSKMVRHKVRVDRWKKSEQNRAKVMAPVIKALETAMEISLDNVPVFEGKTLIALDVSGSMSGQPFQIGSLFMAALAHANPTADMMTFDSTATYLHFDRENILDIRQKIPFRGWGTDFNTIFATANKAYQRFIILSDMQAWEGYYAPDKAHKKYCKAYHCNPYIYSFDLAGYGSLQFPQNKVCALTGFSENIFDIMKVLEMNKNALIDTIEQVTI